MKNYIDLGACDFGRRRLMVYLDTDEYHGIGPMKKHQVRLKYKSVAQRAGEKYRLVFIRVLKKDTEKFAEAMEDLKTKMLICGHTDYETHGGEMIEELEEAFRRRAG